MMTTEIDHQREERIAETSGHELECLENAAELVVAKLDEAGIAYQTGAFYEEIAGERMIDRMLFLLITDESQCLCPSEEE
jgi:hypothetical protein